MTTTHLSILPNWLGDLVMATPALLRWGERARHVVCGAPHLTGLVDDLGLADAVVVYDRHGDDRSWRRWPHVARRLRSHDPARVLVLGPSLRAAVLGALSGAPERRGLGGEGRELLLTHVHRVPGGKRSQHLACSWWEAACGRGTPPRPRWRAGPRGRTSLATLVARFPGLAGPYAVFATGAAYGPTKRWPEASFERVAHDVARAYGWTPVFVGSSSPAEVQASARLADATGGIALAGQTDLPTLVALLEAARLFVGNDSGPMHVAAATGIPTVGIFGSTSPTWTAPRGEQAVVVGPGPVDCSPCFRADCPFDLECLRELTPSVVLAAVEQLVGVQGARP